MIHSMTGFGQGAAAAGESAFKVEIRAVNNRFREIIVKLPRSLLALEEPLKKLVAERIARGRLEVFVRLEGEPPWRRLRVNLALARQYLDALDELKEELGLAGEPELELVAGFREVIGLSDETPEVEAVWPVLAEAAEKALDGLLAMRRSEGERLTTDILERIEAIEAVVGRIEKAAPELTAAAQERIRERVESLIDQEIDPDRLAQETAILADKSDVTEELVRLRSHLDQFRTIMDQGGSIGRKLDFLAQEILRELNTIGSKSADADISREIIEAKAEQEKIREQIQNIE